MCVIRLTVRNIIEHAKKNAISLYKTLQPSIIICSNRESNPVGHLGRQSIILSGNRKYVENNINNNINLEKSKIFCIKLLSKTWKRAQNALKKIIFQCKIYYHDNASLWWAKKKGSHHKTDGNYREDASIRKV